MNIIGIYIGGLYFCLICLLVIIYYTNKRLEMLEMKADLLEEAKK